MIAISNRKCGSTTINNNYVQVNMDFKSVQTKW